MVDSIRDRESLKADRRSGVLYLVIGLILLVLIFCVLASCDSNSLGSIIDAPSFIFVLALQLFALACGGQLLNFANGISMLFNIRKYSKEELKPKLSEFEYAINMGQKAAVLAGAMVTIFGVINVIRVLWIDNFPMVGPNLAVAFIALFYGVAFAFLLMPIKSRIHKMMM